jgi:geranylgeranyl reductase family protein
MSTVDVLDVLIVGAGPAGAWAAYRLARAGARVAIVDGSHPREKPCGGGITARALELVRPAFAVDRVTSVAIETAAFLHHDREARVPLTSGDCGVPPLVVAGRRDFDGALLRAAIDAGAEHVPKRVIDIRPGADSWTIATRTGDLTARWLLGADGANSLVRRRVLRPFDRADLSIATGYFVRNRSSRDIVVEFEDEPAGYLWSFPRPDHLAIGIGAQADDTTSAALLASAARWISRHVGSDTTMERYSWPIPSLDEAGLARERVAGARWMLLGDAAGLVDPITREGIYFALRSGDLAAEALLDEGEPGRNYTARVHDEIYAELLRAARLKARFFRPRFTGLLITALTRSPQIRRVMADLVAGRQGYRGLRQRLLKTFELRLMFELFGY